MILDWLDDPHPEHGIHAAGESVTYVELAHRVRRMAAGLGARGVGPGAVVRLALPPGIDFAVAAYGALLAGAAVCPLAPTVTPGWAEGAGLLIRDGGEVAALCAAGDPPGRLPGSGPVALVQLTSGSSGTPRGVRIGWPALSANVAAIVEWLRMTVDDRVASWLPFHHDMGLVGILVTSVTRQADLTLVAPSDFVRSPAGFLRLFDRGGATLTAMPAFGLRHIVRRVRPQALESLDLSDWRGLIVGAERIDPDVLDRFASRLSPAGFHRSALLPAYGLAESTLMVTGARLADPPTTLPGLVGCGYPVGDTNVSIVDESGQPVGEDMIGEIVVAGSSLASGYADGALAASGYVDEVSLTASHADENSGNADETSAYVDDRSTSSEGAGARDRRSPAGPPAAFHGSPLRTGDAGFLHDGELFVVGRFGDSVKVHGQTLFAEELERLAVAAGAPAERITILAGVHDGQSTVVLLAERLDPAVLDAAKAAVQPALGDVRLVVVNAPARAVARTTSGKPRRRPLWHDYVQGTGVFHDLETQ